jgi:vancomycin resistance protein VanJ
MDAGRKLERSVLATEDVEPLLSTPHMTSLEPVLPLSTPPVEVPSMWSSLHLGTVRSLYGVVAVGVFARLVRDQMFGLSTLYYGLPLPVLAVVTLALTVLQRRERKRAIRWAICTALLIAGIWTDDWRGQPDRSESRDVKVVFWNACRIHRGWDHVTAEVRSWDADVIALVEAGIGTEESRQHWQTGCPGYKVSLLGAGIVLLTRGESGESTVHEFPDGSRARQITTTVHGQALNLVIVDIQANPFWSRREPLAHLAQVVKPLAGESTLVLGDFNTPADSALLAPLRSEYTMAFDLAGQGYRATWPIPLPVLAIDQAWASPRVDVTSCRHLWTRASDHRPVALTVRSVDEVVFTTRAAGPR